MSSEMKLTERGLALMRAGLTRRQLLRVLGISAAGVATTGLLAACDDDDDTAADDDTGDAAAEPDDDSDDDTEDVEEADDAGDDRDDDEVADDATEDLDDNGRPAIVVGVPGLTDTLDANTSRAMTGVPYYYIIFEMLFRRDYLDSDPPGYGTTLEPNLAEDWEFVDDVTLEVRLREDIVWHNGDQMTAEDVVFTFERILDEDIEDLAVARSHFSSLAGVEQVDDYTVHLLTDAPDPTFELSLVHSAGWIIPKDYYEEVGADEFRLNPIGSGPYKVVSFAPGEELNLEAHDDYWMHRPLTSGVQIRAIPEVSGRISGLISGEFDIITQVPPDQIESIEAADGVHTKSTQAANMHLIRFNTHHPNIADKRIRQALCYAIDRQLLVDMLWHGEAHIPDGFQWLDYPDHLYFDDFAVPYDPDRAQELMEEAGYDGELINFRISPGYYAGYDDAAQAIVEMWHAVGFNAELEFNEAEPFAADENQMAHAWSNTSPGDPNLVHWTQWGEGTAVQQDHWDAPEEYNELGREQARTVDPDRRAEIWREMMEIFTDERPGTPLYNWLQTWGIRDGIEWQPYMATYVDIREYNFSIDS